LFVCPPHDRPSSTNGTGYNDKHVKWLLKVLEKILSACFTHRVTVCNALMSFVSFRMHVPVEPNEQERQKSKIFLSLYPGFLRKVRGKRSSKARTPHHYAA